VVHAGHLGRFSADQRAARLHAALAMRRLPLVIHSRPVVIKENSGSAPPFLVVSTWLQDHANRVYAHVHGQAQFGTHAIRA
jgi:hypothetical protein